MPKVIRVFFWGILISFLGSLPLGTLNIAAMQIGIQESINNALFFALGSLTVEMIYVRISLIGIDWVRRQKKLLKIMEWITLSIIIALAAGSMFMCAINPVQIPFWFGWSTILFTKGVLEPNKNQYNFYIVGIGIGTLLGNCVFIFGGKWMVQRIANSEHYLNWVIGGIFAITAVIQLVKIMLHKDAVTKFGEEQEVQ